DNRNKPNTQLGDITLHFLIRPCGLCAWGNEMVTRSDQRYLHNHMYLWFSCFVPATRASDDCYFANEYRRYTSRARRRLIYIAPNKCRSYAVRRSRLIPNSRPHGEIERCPYLTTFARTALYPISWKTKF